MTLPELIRMILPARLTMLLAVWSINLAAHSWTTLKWYLTLLYGKPPLKIGLTKTHCYFDYKGHRIFAPKIDAGIFIEIFQDNVYEQVWQPKVGDTVIDIGAYVGMFTVKASEAVGDTGQVIAVEPCPETFRILKENCAGCRNVRLVKVAIMSQVGIGKLYYLKSAAANSLVTQGGKYVEVETMTLDRLVERLKLNKVDFIKIDAEGAGLEILQGGIETLKKGTHIAIAAYHDARDGKREIDVVTKFLKEIGYQITYQKGLRSYVYAEKAI